MPQIVFDIETVKNERADEFFANKQYYPKANLKKEELIQKDLAEKRAKDLRKAALHWWTCKIISISWSNVRGSETLVVCSPDEKQNLITFFTALEKLEEEQGEVTLCGKYSYGFDMPVVRGRAMFHNIGLLECLRQRYAVTDIDKIWNSSKEQVPSLDTIAFGIGLTEGKCGDGLKVQEWADAKNYEAIAVYNIQDVDITKEILKRYLKNFMG